MSTLRGGWIPDDRMLSFPASARESSIESQQPLLAEKGKEQVAIKPVEAFFNPDSALSSYFGTAQFNAGQFNIVRQQSLRTSGQSDICPVNTPKAIKPLIFFRWPVSECSANEKNTDFLFTLFGVMNPWTTPTAGTKINVEKATIKINQGTTFIPLVNTSTSGYPEQEDNHDQ